MLSANEPTWDKEKGCHTCCGSTHSPSHKSWCPNRKSTIPGRSSDPDFVNVQELKAQGLSSGEVAKRLNIPLDQVNELWIP